MPDIFEKYRYERDLTGFTLVSGGGASVAGGIFAGDVAERSGSDPRVGKGPAVIRLIADDGIFDHDFFRITETDGGFEFKAHGTRGLIYACGMFLRKSSFKNGRIILRADISGAYTPAKKIRGHQLGYRPLPNTYDAWSPEQFRRYCIDLMYFGMNTVEHIPFGGYDGGVLMKHTPEEMVILASEDCEMLDLDLSLWIPNDPGETAGSTEESRRELFSKLKRLDHVFIPGSDPGDLGVKELFERVAATRRALDATHPNARVWPSAQAPRELQPGWGGDFIETMNGGNHGAAGFITGPNHAMPIHELRSAIDSRYPLRFYPDITHSLRCEYPVNHERDDWHFAFQAAQSREFVDPRPDEFARLHKSVSRYTVGSVSYSEGVHDDVNKVVWGDLDYRGDGVGVTGILTDYCALFFPGLDAEKAAAAIAALERDWQRDPADCPETDRVFAELNGMLTEAPELTENWRFMMLYFRALGDRLVRARRIYETGLIKAAEPLMRAGDISGAMLTLATDFPDSYDRDRELFDLTAGKLFDLIGYQTDTEKYHAYSWERGAVLETIDRPVTDRAWLRRMLRKALLSHDGKEYMRRVLDRNKIKDGEYYFSVAYDWPDSTGVPVQDGEIYINPLGDRPENAAGSIPTCMYKVYDNRSFRFRAGGFTPGVDHELKINIVSDGTYPEIRIGGETVTEHYADADFDGFFPTKGFETAVYRLPARLFSGGCAEIEFYSETCVRFCEFRIVRAGAVQEVI